MKIAIVLAASCMFAELLGADLDVRAFGAKGDGVAKDTAALQKAIDSAAEAGGGRIVVPAGKYLTGSIYLKDNDGMRLVDHGAGEKPCRDGRVRERQASAVCRLPECAGCAGFRGRLRAQGAVGKRYGRIQSRHRNEKPVPVCVQRAALRFNSETPHAIPVAMSTAPQNGGR